jgi:hypothetical protein
MSVGSLAMAFSLLPGCQDGHFTFLGYTTAPNYDTTIHTVYLPIVQNKTMIVGSIEFDVTRNITTEIHQRTPYRVVNRKAGADTELIVTIKNRDKSVINMNQLGETREALLGINFEVVWRDLRKGHEGEILSAPKLREGVLPPLGPDGRPKDPPPVLLSPITFYIPEIGDSDATAKLRIYKTLGIQIANMMEVSGKGWR